MVDFRQVAGGALTGLGDSLKERALSRRAETLEKLRREWAVEDREASAALAREGWDRADARSAAATAAAGRAAAGGRGGAGRRMTKADLVEVVDADGRRRYLPAAKAEGQLVPEDINLNEVTDRYWTNTSARKQIAAEENRERNEKVAAGLDRRESIWRSAETEFGGDRNFVEAGLNEFVRMNPFASDAEIDAETERLVVENRRRSGSPDALWGAEAGGGAGGSRGGPGHPPKRAPKRAPGGTGPATGSPEWWMAKGFVHLRRKGGAGPDAGQLIGWKDGRWYELPSTVGAGR